ncbi:MAG: FAD-dependent monooxygenase [Acidobacteriota bacterium]
MISPSRYDVVIAGAGPAGAVAATVLARAGARVLVLDRAQFPRGKLCGDTLNPGALAVLARLGLESASSGAFPLDGMIVTGEGDVRVEGRYGGVHGRAILRRDFDAALVAAARGAGATVDEGVLVDGPALDTSGAAPVVVGLMLRGKDRRLLRVGARVVIAADGRYSRVARAVQLSRSAFGPRRWAIGAYFEDVAGMRSFGEMHVRRNHYIGVAPLPSAVTNACVVTPSPSGRSMKQLLWDALRADPLLRERFAASRMITEPICLGPLAVDCEVAGTAGLLLAGDAAGFIDPMTGDGLRFALRGAELAAAEALHALEHGVTDGHVRLLQARRREFAHKWRFNRSLRTMVAFPGAVRVARYAAMLAPAGLQQVIRYAGDVHAA